MMKASDWNRRKHGDHRMPQTIHWNLSRRYIIIIMDGNFEVYAEEVGPCAVLFTFKMTMTL